MKVFPLFLLLLLFFQLSYAQESTECSANAGVDQMICEGAEKFQLLAPNSADYNNPPNLKWTYLSGPVPAADITITPDDALAAEVTHNGPFPLGEYIFELCVDCADINLDGQNDRPCDVVKITVTSQGTVASITENDGAEDGEVEACTGHLFQLSQPNAGETWAISIDPEDGNINYSFDPATGELDVSLIPGRRPRCSGYTIYYNLSNGGCSTTDSVQLFLVGTQTDPNGNAFGVATPCPNCGNTVDLYGSYPGCGASGTWTLAGAPPGGNANLNVSSPAFGYASFTIDAPGEYTFEYTVSGNSPCPSPAPIQVSCTFLLTGDFELGNSEVFYFCGELLPAGNYPLSAPFFEDALYQWTINSVSPSGAEGNLSFSNPNASSTDLIVNPDIVGDDIQITLSVQAQKFYLDPDCDGPQPAEVIPLPDPLTEESIKKFLEEIDQLNNDTTQCLYICSDNKYFYFRGTPTLSVEADTITFLCSDGSETFSVSDYIDYTSFPENSVGHPLQQPSNGNLPPSMSIFSDYTFVEGNYLIEVIVSNEDDFTDPPFTCSDTAYLTIIIRTPEEVNAGTPQIKCINEEIRLNGNQPFEGEATGTWTQVNCSPCDVGLVEPNNPNTQILLGGIDPSSLPTTLFFEWSFTTSEGNCLLSDTTSVTVDTCFLPCENFAIYVEEECLPEGGVQLTLFNENGLLIDPNIYELSWTVGSQNINGENPITVQAESGTAYSVSLAFSFDGELICENGIEGTINCGKEFECGEFTIIESCSPGGGVLLTAVDENGDPIVPQYAQHDLRWYIYGNDINGPVLIDDENPVLVSPQACYRLRHDLWVYPDDAPWQVPGLHDSVCVYTSDLQCVSIECDCEIPAFLIAGCGDDQAVLLNLPFPEGCSTVCNGSSGTVGVFNLDGTPLDETLYNISWSNGQTGNFIQGLFYQGQLYATVTLRENEECFWQASYKPSCVCTDDPTYIHCEQRIVRKCYGETIEYYDWGTYLEWIGVAGATDYVLEFDYDNTGECCTNETLSGTEFDTTGGDWLIPDELTCFSVRVKALGEFCEETEWSAWYTYCPDQNPCDTAITQCGCCNGVEGRFLQAGTDVLPETTIENMIASGELSLISEATSRETPPEQSTYAEFAVFPNPFFEKFQISTPPLSGPLQVQVLDLLQRQVLIQQMDGQQSHWIDLSNRESGVYLIQILDDQGRLLYTEKVFKAKR